MLNRRMINMKNSNSENQLQPGANPKVERSSDQRRKERHDDWFAVFLKYQAERNTFFEYLITEDKNGRQ